MQRALSWLASAILLVAAACGGSDNNDGNADGSVSGPDADPTAPDADPNAPDAIPPSSFNTLIERSWSIPAGQEFYRCKRMTVTEDMYIAGFRAIAPNGTHHTVLSVDTSGSAADGEFDCDAGTNAHAMLFASGVGTDDLYFPGGVAMKVTAGTQLLLNLHLYNVGETTLTGSSGTMVATIPASAVEQEAEVIFAGTFLINLRGDLPADTVQKVSGGCNFDRDQTVMTVWPHMHQLGVHMKVTHNGTALHDKAYSFNEQVNYPITPVVVKNGDRIDVECSYINNTGQGVTFGDSSDSEMCFAGLYRYPASNAGLFDCSATF
jgi:hypothetical protein